MVVPGAGDEADDDNYPRDKFPRLARPWAIQGDPHRDDASSPCQASIALMTVAIGRYMEFVPDLWVSTQRYFLPDCHVELFVFTDDVTHALGQDPAIHLVGQFRLGWPYDSLMRFEMYQSQADLLRERFQYVYAVDSDAVFTAVMGRENKWPIQGRTVGIHGKSFLYYYYILLTYFTGLYVVVRGIIF